MQVNASTTAPRLSPFSAPPGAQFPKSPELPQEPVDGFSGTSQAAEASSLDKPKGNWKHRVIGTTLAGLALTGVVGGVAGTVMLNAPICPGQTSLVSISHEGVCVSPNASMGAAEVFRQIQGTAHITDGIQDLTSSQSRVFQPNGNYKAPEASQDGQMKMVSWNLHHGEAPSQDGSRDQVGRMVQQLRGEKADVFLLQEVTPWDAQTLVDGTGMVGYYTQTTPSQGDMILVHPDLKVLDNAKAVINKDIDSVAEATQAVFQTGGSEPRAAQALRVALPDGQTVVVWNTHLSTNSATDEAREAERQKLLEFVEGQALPGDSILGGGDLNNSSSAPTPTLLRNHGFNVKGAKIDWLAGRGTKSLETSYEQLMENPQLRLSDHPIVRGQAQF